MSSSDSSDSSFAASFAGAAAAAAAAGAAASATTGMAATKAEGSARKAFTCKSERGRKGKLHGNILEDQTSAPIKAARRKPDRRAGRCHV